jgi:hypothetical protein
LRAACANRSKGGLEQRVTKDAKKWPNPSDYTVDGSVSGQVNLRVAGSYPTSLMRDFLQYSSLFVLFIHLIQLRSSAG